LDLTGRALDIKVETQNPLQFRMDLTGLAAGIYLVKAGNRLKLLTLER
jgi:hypothetical protein